MPDLKTFTITKLANASVTVPRWTLSGQLVDSGTGAVLADFTGANTVAFPGILATLTAAQQDELIQMVAVWLLQKKFPQFFS